MLNDTWKNLINSQEFKSLFDDKSPFLVEVRFQGAGTSADWHLVHDYDDIVSLLGTLNGKAKVLLKSVWDIEHPDMCILV